LLTGCDEDGLEVLARAPARAAVHMALEAIDEPQPRRSSPLAESLDLRGELLTDLHINRKKLLIGAAPTDEVLELLAHLHFVLEVEEREGEAVRVRT